MMPYVKAEVIDLARHPELNERWVQDRIGQDTSILGLGNLILKERERIQPGAGRLDLLLQDVDTSRRSEVEIQLGKTDESHIIRTIEYWDIERKRYPQYDILAQIQGFAPGFELNYNRFYIGLPKDGRPNNFVVFRPKRKNYFNLEPRLKPADETQKKLEDAGMDWDYDKLWSRYRLRLGKDDFAKHKQLIMELLQLAWEKSRH